MLTDDERLRLSAAIHDSMRRLMANYEEFHTEAARLTQTFEDTLEECIKRAVKADRASTPDIGCATCGNGEVSPEFNQEANGECPDCGGLVWVKEGSADGA